MQTLIFSNNVAKAVRELIAGMNPDKVFVVADKNTCNLLPVEADGRIALAAGDDHKQLGAVESVWSMLVDGGATRRSLVVNLGGGMITDLGGFAAATFKRGIRFVNVPTTLLGAVDAAVGGKTGINFMGLKNEVGAFCEADAVVISTAFFGTLPREELMSGYAEMVKHALISDHREYARLLTVDPAEVSADEFLEMLQRSVEVKRRIVAEDPRETGLRKALNLGHTAGHALEELAMRRSRPVPHGKAVAHGLLVEMILSNMQLGFPSEEIQRYAAWLRENYGPLLTLTCDDYPELLELMSHDKKNVSASQVNFTLLRTPGTPEINCTATPAAITAALDIYRDLI